MENLKVNKENFMVSSTQG